MHHDRHRRGLALTLLVVAAGWAVGCERDVIGSNIGPGSFNPDETIFENLLDLKLGDAGYGASILLEDQQFGYSGSLAFQLRNPNDTSELKLMDWEASRVGENTGTQVQTVTLADGAGPFTALGRNQNTGRRYLAYQNAGDGTLKLLEETGNGVFTEHLIDADGNVGLFVDMQVDSVGGVHLAYLEKGQQDLRYALWQDGALLVGPDTVDSGLESGQLSAGGAIDFEVSLALNAAGQPAITYYDATNGQLRTARFDTSAQNWKIEVIGKRHTTFVLSPDADGLASLPGDQSVIRRQAQAAVYENGVALDNSAWEFVVGSDTSETLVQIVAYDAGAEYTIDYSSAYGGDYGRWSSTVFLSTGAQLISFFDFTRGDLVVARNASPGESPTWSFTIVDGSGVVGDFNELELVPLLSGGVQQGSFPVISYFDQSRGDLKLAVLKPDSSWETMALDTRGITGLGSAVAAADEGYIVVAYRTFDLGTASASLRMIRTVPTD